MRKDFQVVYSEHTLAEINKIEDIEFRVQHLDALNYLHAIYWNPKFKNDSLDAIEVYKTFGKSKSLPFSSSLEANYRDFIMSLNGIDIGASLEESFSKLISEAVDIPFSYISTKLPIISKPVKLLNKKLSNYILNKVNPFAGETIDFLSFIPEMRAIVNNPELERIEQYPAETVYQEIVNRLINHDNHFINTFQHVNDSIENRIEFMFLFLNWVGYYPDKFQNITNKKGFHDASMLDARHSGVAWHFDYIISSDEKFRKKCDACYHFISAKAQVISLEEFLGIFSSRI